MKSIIDRLNELDHTIKLMLEEKKQTHYCRTEYLEILELAEDLKRALESLKSYGEKTF